MDLGTSKSAASKEDDFADYGSITPQQHSFPILVYLSFLIFVIVVPSLAFTGVLLQRHNEAQEKILETFTVATTRSVGQAVEREVSGMMTTLKVLIAHEMMHEDNTTSLHNIEYADVALNGTGSRFLVFDKDLKSQLSAGAANGLPVGEVADTSDYAKALDSVDPILSELSYDERAGTHYFSVISRFIDDGIIKVAGLTQNVSVLTNALLTGELPEGWQVAIVDRSNIIIGSSNPGLKVGETLFLQAVVPHEHSGRWWDRSVHGEDYVTITQKSVLTGWNVVAWAPVSVVTGPLREAIVWLLFGSIIIVGLALIASFLIARQIARSVRGISRQAQQLGAGAEVVPVHYAVTELEIVSKTLADSSRKRREAESEVRFLMRELAHRSKNQLTVISSMAKQTAHGAQTVPQFIENFQSRIFGLARSTDLLLSAGVHGIGLRELLKTQIDAFRPDHPSRIVKVGPRVRLNVQAAQTLGMAFHELATNAVKYGAFSTDVGVLRVSWKRTGGDILLLSWREVVENFIAPNERKGFGTTVVKTMVSSALNAEVERILHADGIEWVFRIPLDQIDPERDDDEVQISA